MTGFGSLEPVSGRPRRCPPGHGSGPGLARSCPGPAPVLARSWPGPDPVL